MRESTPRQRASDVKKQTQKIRRRYSKNVGKTKKLLPGEVEHVEDMVVLLTVAGYTRTQTAKIVGISRDQVREMLELSHVTEKLVGLRAALPAAALELLEGYMIEAVQVIVDVMRTTEDDKYALAAAGEILDRAGMPKASRQERHNLNEDSVKITDGDGILEKLRSASPEVQEQAAQVIEQLEGLLATASETGEISDDAS
jgi:hypothetical protein